MTFRFSLRGALLALALLLAIAALGCTKSPHKGFVPNQPPTLDLTAAPIDTRDTAFYAYRINWSGSDPDGRIDHYGYAIDPPVPTAANPHPDTAWVTTVKNEQVMFFKATQPVLGGRKSDPVRAVDYHVFAIRAYDNLGASSVVRSRDFYSYTIAPTVNVTRPLPSLTSIARVTPAVRISWAGSDPDGQFSQKPVKYKYRLFVKGGDVDIVQALIDPQSFRHQQAAANFAGWDSVGGDTTTVQFTGLVPNNEYLFVVIGYDEAGAYNADWSGNGNMLDMVVGYAGTLGPVITCWNEFFQYTMPTGGFNPSVYVDLEIPAKLVVTFNWLATPPAGADISWYRWRVDGNVDDETPRSNESTDWYHWSQKSPSMVSCTIGPYLTTDEHKLYIETEDNNGMRSLLTVRFFPVVPTMSDPVLGHDLLVVNDTRLEPDKYDGATGLQKDYTLSWPSSAELDTFLFARGGTVWHPIPSDRASWLYPASHPSYTSRTPPGLFAGYSFDTLGTRMGFEVATAGVPFSRLAQYRHIVWMTDHFGGTNTAATTDPSSPMSTLHYMNVAGHSNTFSTYAFAGGKVWLLGGAAAYASLSFYNAKGAKDNDRIYSLAARQTVFSSLPQYNEMVSGRMMYDGAHWQSEMVYQVTTSQVIKARGIPAHARPTPGWKFSEPNHSPDFNLLPATMRGRGTLATHLLEDSLPPTRATTGNGPGQYYTASSVDVEYLSQPNYVIEDVDPDPVGVTAVSTLVSLMDLRGGSLANTGYEPVTMTWYHGVNAPEFVFSGFTIWNYARRDCQTLVDFVMQQLWGMPFNASARSTPALAAKRGVTGPTGASPVAVPYPVRARVPVGRPTGR